MINELKIQRVQNFISQHEHEDLYALVLNSKKYPDIPVKLAIDQINSRRKAKKKLPEWYAKQGILFPHGVSIEQCSSEATARYKAGLISGESLVDLTGGTGVDSYYMSNSFVQCHLIEQDALLCAFAHHNLNLLDANNIKIIESDAERYISSTKSSPDWYYVDPARRDQYNKKVFRLSDCSPNLSKIYNSLLKAKKGVLIKLAPFLDITQLITELPDITRIYVIAVNNECKELVAMVETKGSDELSISAINFNDKVQEYQFSYAQEQKAASQYSQPQKYIYEPNASIMKSGAFKMIGVDFNLNKLHPNSHLYTSQELVTSFPGRVFQLKGVSTLKKNKLPGFEKEKANITSRNYPMSVRQIRNKTGLNEGGDSYLLATTTLENSPKILICEKLSFQEF